MWRERFSWLMLHYVVYGFIAGVIYEAYKPGTEPGQNRNLGLQRAPGEDEEEMPIAASREPEAEARPVPMRGAPAGGTGGLY